MAGLRAIATTAEVVLTAATARTVLQLVAAANHRVKLERWGVAFDGVSVTGEPVQVRLLRQTTAGTMTANTPKKLSSHAEVLQTTAQDSATGAEPTAGDVLDVMEVHPQTGYDVMYGLGQEIELPGAGRIGIECTAPAGVNVRAKMQFDE